MALIEKIDLNPPRSELRKFGFVACGVFGALGGYVRWQGGLPVADFPESAGTVSLVLWGVALLSLIFSLAAPRANRPLYTVLVVIGYPIGIVVSFLLLVVFFFGLITPIGLVFRLLRRDPLHRTRDPEADSYWVDHVPVRDPSRYFKQF